MPNKLILMMAIAAMACGDEEPEPEVGTIAGTITGAAGPLANAEVTAAGGRAASAADGSYELDDLAPGAVDVSVAADWYADGTESADVTAGKTTTVDVRLTPAALRVEAADAALATTFNGSADWTSDLVSIAQVSAPTRALLELAIHYENPALYRDPGGEAQVTPPALPTLVTPATLDFEVGSGTGVQALDVATAVDDVTTISAGTPSDGVLLWEPALHYLLNTWSFDDATPLFTAGVAVRQQKWGGTGMLPTQEIQRVHLDGGDIWVEVVFQDFVDLAGDITDVDGDGSREVWARVDPVHFDALLYAELRDTYVGESHGTLELAEILTENLDVLYSRGTNANVVNTIGVPYTHADLGAVEYPFAVVLHGSIMITNVFLVEP